MKPGSLVSVRKKYQVWCNHIFFDSEGYVCKGIRVTPETQFLFLGFEDEWRLKGEPIAKVLLGDKVLYVNPTQIRISR